MDIYQIELGGKSKKKKQQKALAVSFNIFCSQEFWNIAKHFPPLQIRLEKNVLLLLQDIKRGAQKHVKITFLFLKNKTLQYRIYQSTVICCVKKY